MGGAQAGEVASRLAAAAFREFHEADDLDGEARVEAIIQEANRRIHERARVDASASGMGTTVTAALVERGGITFGHVGDSRAYRIRNGALEQLTQDHSLVADLVRSGRITAEEADAHPQRSVITRALGTDPEVDVDTFSVEAEPGDVFLLCSDGLTTMVEDGVILRLVRESPTLDQAAKALVQAANRSGGEDNVTVVLFTVEGADSAALEETAALAAGDRRDGEPDELEDTLSGLEATAPVAPADPPRDPAADDEPGARWEPVAAAETAPAGAHGRGRRLFLVLATVAFGGLLLLGAFWALANAHFVGAEADGRVAVYQGLPYEVSDQFSLYRARYLSDLRAVQLSPEEREGLFDHDLTTYEGARARLRPFEEEGVP